MMFKAKPILRPFYRSFFLVLALIAVLLLSACSQASAAIQDGAATQPPALPTRTALPTLPVPSATAAIQYTPTALRSVPPARALATAAPTTARMAFPALCADWCSFEHVFSFSRPLPASAQLAVDPSYRFGSTQNGARDPHHGVEFLNPSGTPVLAAGDGKVVIAGDDTRQLHSPYYNFYGNLVVLQHSLPGLDQPVFTLYAHLSEIDVQVGDQLKAGDPLGKVGMSGSATGSHLHFEVRLGENIYAASRNPELWLIPLEGPDGSRYAALAGRILYPSGYRSELSSVVIERLTGPKGDAVAQVYLTPYEESALSGQPPWEETFAAGDLPPGWYRITFIQFGLQHREVQLLPGQLTLVTFDLRSGQ